MGTGCRAVCNEDIKLFRGKGMEVTSNTSKIYEMQPCFLVFVTLSAGQGQLLSHQVSYTFIYRVFMGFARFLQMLH